MYQQLTGSSLQIDDAFYNFINEEVLPLVGKDPWEFWNSLADLVNQFQARNAELLKKRDQLQQSINAWHLASTENTGSNIDPQAYRDFLQEIGYLVDEGDDFQIDTENVDPEIATMAGPQLVVPLKNARFALNAANARWGSLYDALYGTDVISSDDGRQAGAGYNPRRGDAVIAYAKSFLDQTVALAKGSHTDAVAYRIESQQLQAVLTDGTHVGLAAPEKFAGYKGDPAAPAAILLNNNALHIEIQIDATGAIGKSDAANVNDIVLESAITTIMDCEDSIAAVDTEDKIEVYRNWLGLMQGSLQESFDKNGKTITRVLHDDRNYIGADRHPYSLSGRSLLFIRNVGHLMTIGLVKTKDGDNIAEGILDGVFTSLIGSIDINKTNGLRNSQHNSIYIVKPKMHGPEEVRFTCDLFDSIENMLELPANTIKLGIMDEERRTSVNLKACIREAKSRLVFINTGFLDRTGDEIHTSMEAGAFLPKDQIKQQDWINAYERRNVTIGLACGLSGKAQIGKGMWAKPDEMAEMMTQKIAHPRSGATTAWVPSPTAATLHAMHYHSVDVFAVHKELAAANNEDNMAELLTLPLLGKTHLSSEQIERELENNVQGILGYVVRWVEQGVGCSKVPDINNVGLMEDRATLRISAKHIANWLHHGICSKSQVLNCLERMATIVDQQNQSDINYQNMSDNLEASLGFQAAKALIFESQEQPNGYTEPLLHAFRLKEKQGLGASE